MYWAILEHIVTGIKYYSLPYNDTNKFTIGEIICDIQDREYLIIGWTTIEPKETLIDVSKCSVWDEFNLKK